MKKLFAIAMLAVSLAGCGTLGNIGTGISLVTKSIANPVTTTDQYSVEASFRIVVGALQAYKSACAAGTADANCRANVATIQVYTRQVPPYLTNLRAFLRNNDQINAINTYNELVALITQAKQTAAALGINLGS